MSVLKNRALGMVIVVFVQNLIIAPVYWKRKSAIIRFDDNVTLICMVNKTDDCDNKTTRRWDGGLDKKLLLYNGFSSNRQKYIELTDHPCYSFSLVILSLGKHDVDCEYSCSFGFETSKQMLNLSNHDFIKEPSEINILLSNHDSKTETKIEMCFYQVYPIPTCTIKMGDEGLVLEEQSVSSEIPGDMFYNVIIRTEANATCAEIHNNMKVHCTLLSFEFTQVRTMHTMLNCTGQILDADTTFKITMIIIGAGIFLCGLIYIGLQYFKISSTNTTKGDADSEIALQHYTDKNKSTRKFQDRKRKGRNKSGTL